MPVRARPDRFLLLLSLMTEGAATAHVASRYHFSVPAGPLTAGVARIGALTGDNIVAPDAAILAGRGAAVQVDGYTGDALAALLHGSRAKPLRVGERTWKIVPASKSVRQEALSPPHVADMNASIIVTGAKRELPLSRYAAGISLIDGEQLRRFGAIPDMGALSRIEPALQSTHLGPGRDKLFLRGISDSSFNGAGAALVGLYVNDLRLTYNAPNPDLRLFDVRRVEILEGPQGTLYGAGSMAGLVRVVPNAPVLDRAEGALWLGGTTVAHGSSGLDIGAIANIPLLRGRSALRLVAYAEQDGGYIDDAGRGARDVNRTRIAGGRGAFRIALGEEWIVETGGIAQDIRNRDAQYAERGLSRLERDTMAAQPSQNLFRSGDVVVAGPAAGVEITSTTGITHQFLGQTFLPEDGNAGVIYRQTDRVRLISEEIRLSSRPGSLLQWVAGSSMLSGRTQESRTINFNSFRRSLGNAGTTVLDKTLFGEMTVHLRPRLTLTAGGRISWIRLGGVAVGARAKEVDGDNMSADTHPLFEAVRHEHFVAPSLALGWSPAEGRLLFLRYSEGFRPGGQTAGRIIERFDADRIYAFEAGFRLTPEGARLSMEMSAVISRWKNVQADVLDPDGLPATQNVGDGVVRSLNARLQWKIVPMLEAKIVATVARGHVTGYDAVADTVIRTPLPDVAKDALTASLTSRHTVGAGMLEMGMQVTHIGRSVLGSGSELSRIGQGGYWVLGGGSDVRVGPATWSLSVDNILDSPANSFAFGIPSFRYDNSRTTPLRPRSIRLGVRREF